MGNSDGTTTDFYSISQVIYAAVVIVSNLKAVLDTSVHEVVSISCADFGLISYIFWVFSFSSDYILSKSIVIRSYILDNITMVVLDLKYFFCLLGSCMICCFLEIVCDKYPILFGCVVEGKNLPPYKQERRDSDFYRKYSYCGDDELLNAYSRTSSKSSTNHDLEKEK
jgi:hypothetical protein